MTGLRAHPRDPALLQRAGDAWLRSRDPEGVQLFVLRHMTLAGAPSPVSAELSYARWKPGTSLSCVYRVGLSDGSVHDVVVKRHRAGKAAALVERLLAEEPRADGAHGLHPAAVWGDDSVWVVPNDPQLPGLQRAHDCKRAKRWLDALDLCPGWRVRSQRSSASLLRYRPETRAVLCWDLALKSDTGERSVRRFAVRALPPRVATRVASRRVALGAVDGLPTLLGHEARTGLLLEAWMPVTAFDPGDFSHAPRAGALLARLHAVAPPANSGALVRRDDAIERRASLRELLAWSPELVALFERLPAPARAVDSDALRWTHGDVHPDQFAHRSGEQASALLDLDRLALGDPLNDLASWIADQLVADPALDVLAAMEPLLSGYTGCGGVEPELGPLVSALREALVQRAVAGLRRLERDAEARAATLLRRALELAPSVGCAP